MPEGATWLSFQRWSLDMSLHFWTSGIRKLAYSFICGGTRSDHPKEVEPEKNSRIYGHGLVVAAYMEIHPSTWQMQACWPREDWLTDAQAGALKREKCFWGHSFGWSNSYCRDFLREWRIWILEPWSLVCLPTWQFPPSFASSGTLRISLLRDSVGSIHT